VNLARSPEQEALAEALNRLLRKLSPAERVREVEVDHGGFDGDLWAALADVGVPAMAAAAGPGGGATMVDLAVVSDRCGAHLASAPVVESLVAARVMGDAPADGVVVFDPTPGGSRVLPWGAVVSAVVRWRDDQLVVHHLDGGRRRPARCLWPRADAEVEPTAETVLAEGPEAARRFALAVDEWRILTASWQAGLARAAVDLGVQYAKDRRQFGVPIGSFQAIAHRLADAHTGVTGAELLAQEAAWAWDEADPRAPALAVAAAVWCGEQAEAAATWSLHVHGGYGFMVEYAIHLHVKRAKALRVAGGRPFDDRIELARRRWRHAGERPERAPADGTLDFGLGPETESFQAEVRAFVAEHLTDDVLDRARTTGTMHDWGLHRAIADRGYLSAGWPVETGGQGRSALDVTVLQQELWAAGAPIDGMGIATMVAATLLLVGNEWQRTEVLPRLLSGDAVPCLGYSEPDAGSDVAAVATRAVRDGDEWVIDGQKMFTTMAHEAAYVFLLTRTSPDKSKHRGLTMFLVPMDVPGIAVTPVETLGGERTNITWYDGVRIPDRCRVGDVDDGWSVMHAALVYERNGANWGEPHRLLEAVAAWAVETGAITDPLVAERLGAAAARDDVGRLLVYRSAWLAASGALPLVEGSMAKLFVTEWFTAMAAELLDCLGPAGAHAHGDPAAVLDGLVEHAYRHSAVTTIYGGSSEVQRGIIAEKGLGLPRSR
jgi:alkylation response protein AidB-like acyl-CoA dehydrogenase